MKKGIIFSVSFFVIFIFGIQTVCAAGNLLAAAKEEGKVVLYSSLPVWANDKLCKAFQKKYDVKAEFYRAGSLKVLQKFLNEKTMLGNQPGIFTA